MKTFPILGSNPNATVPWPFIEQARNGAMVNHGQTLERLAERGGLSWGELFMSLAGKRYGANGTGYPDEAKAQAVILALLKRPDRDSLRPTEVWTIGIAEGVIIVRA